MTARAASASAQVSLTPARITQGGAAITLPTPNITPGDAKDSLRRVLFLFALCYASDAVKFTAK